MMRRVELGSTMLLVGVLTALIVVRGIDGPEPLADTLEPASLIPSPTPWEHSSEMQDVLRLEQPWREEFDTLDHWRLERGKPGTINDGILTLHDAPENAPLYAQKQPLRFQAAELEIAVRSPHGGYLHVGVARAHSGREELTGSGGTPTVRDGIELQLSLWDADRYPGNLWWTVDGHRWISLPVQMGSAGVDNFAIVVVRIRPDGCSLTVDGRAAADYTVPRDHLRWPEAPYRIYVGASGGDPEIGHIELRPSKAQVN